MNIPRGREDIHRLFQNCIQSGRLSQTYIISAPEGMGKKTVTEYILSLMMCDTHTSCGSCPSCLSLDKGCHPDVVYIRRDEDKASLGVDNIRSATGDIYTKPLMSGYKAVIVEEMHLATVSAQNAMLKMIEEPPGRVVFFLICSSMAQILPTIVSRAVVINLKPLTKDALMAIDGADDFLCSVCAGNPGTLKKLISDTDFRDFRDSVVDAFFSVCDKDAYAPYLAAKALEAHKAKAKSVFEIMLMCARDVYFKKIGLDSHIVNKDKINYINTLVSSLAPEKIWHMIKIIEDTASKRGDSGNFTMAVTIMLLRCRSEMRQ